MGVFRFSFQGRGGVGMKFTSPDIATLKQELAKLGDNKVAAKHFAAAMRKALLPGKKALQARTPDGPTGNLKAAIRIKVKQYKRNGGAWGAVGYTIKGSPSKALSSEGTVKLANDRGFHAHLLEFGTQQRFVKKDAGNPRGIASSFKTRGPFSLTSSGSRVSSSPAYPWAFFKRPSKGGRGASTGQTFGVGMLRRSFDSTKGAMGARLSSVMATTVRNAWKDLGNKMRKERGL